MLAAILQKCADAVIHTDLDGVVVGWSPGAERLYRSSADEMIGASVDVLVPDDTWDGFVSLLDQIQEPAAVSTRLDAVFHEFAPRRREAHHA